MTESNSVLQLAYTTEQERKMFAIDIISEEGKFLSMYAVYVPALPRKGDIIDAVDLRGLPREHEVICVYFSRDPKVSDAYEVTVVTK